MKRKRFSEEQIISIFKEAGIAIADLIRQHGIAEGTFYPGRLVFPSEKRENQTKERIECLSGCGCRLL